MDSSSTGESDTTDPMPIVSDGRVSSEREVYTSDTTSTDDDDFQPFALPDAVVEPADGPVAEDLPFVVIPAPIPLAMYPVIDMPLDVVADDDVDLFDDEPLEDDVEGEALIAADDHLLPADAPAEESPVHSPVPDSFESVASAPSHEQGAQHYSHDTDPDRASSAAPAPAPSFAIDHDINDDSDPVFPPGFDPDQEIEFIHLDQPMEDPADPVDPAFADPADFEMEFDDLEPAVAPEPVVAPDPALEHDPIHADVPAVDPLIADVPIDDHPIVAPLLEDDHVVADAHIDAPPLLEGPVAAPLVVDEHVADFPVDPVVVAPFPDPVPLEPDHALFVTHVDPQYAHTRNGWIEDDDDFPPFVVPVTPVSAPASAPFDAPLFPTHTADAHRTDLPITFLQDIPPPRPGEGSSHQPFGHAPFISGGDQFIPPMSQHIVVPPCCTVYCATFCSI
ncbi:calphotin-like [Helianthus annuus]|uniref:calphotin-like n=1 Tax=Helianthus annuus TaxID=4232 RepID=UPI000B8FAECA|nr:calphotin-like [Helianthus annuus]